MTTTPAPSVPDPGPTLPPAVAALYGHAAGDRAGANAVVGIDGTRTFAWLAAAADRVAREVRDTHADPAAHLGVVRRSTAGFVAAVLGCMRAGVPFSVVAAESRVDPRFLGLTAIIDPDTDDDPDAGTPASVTPAPAGVGEDWAASRFELGTRDRIALWSGIPAQIVSTISTAAYAGATLVITPPILSDAALVADRLRADGITVLVMTMPVLRAATARAADGAWPGLRLVVVDHGGELLAADLGELHRVAPAATAASVYRTDRLGVPLAVSVQDGPPPPDGPVLVPAGAPPAGSALAVLNAAGRPVGLGEIGEVCSGTVRTGDLARRGPDGTVELVGSVDVERDRDRGSTLAALRDLPGVHDTVLVDDFEDDGSPLRIGYVATAGLELDRSEARRRLASTLPERLIPRHVVVLDALPLTPAGLHDLDALPEVGHDGTVVDHYLAPRTPLEQELCAVLLELLGVERVGISDSFFQLGGFSLLATQLTTRIRESYGVALTLRDVFDAPTVDGLAHLIVLRQIEGGGDDLEALLAEIEHVGTDPD